MTEDEAQTVLDDLDAHDVEEIEEAMRVLNVAQEQQELFDWVQWYRTMFHLGILMVLVEGLLFAVMAWQHAYVFMPVIVWAPCIGAFMCGRMYERRKNETRRGIDRGY